MCRYHAALSETLSGQAHDFDGLMSEFEQATYEMTNLGLADVSGADLYVFGRVLLSTRSQNRQPR